MKKHIFGAVGLGLLLLLWSAPAVLLAHEGHDHGERRGGYKGEQEDSRRYDPQYDDDRWKDEDEDDDTYRPSSRRYPPPDREQSSPRERRDRPR